MRTRIVDQKYLEEFIAESLELNGERELKFQNEQIAPERLPAVNRFHFTSILHLAISRYTVGEPVKQIIPDLLKCIEMADQVWPHTEDNPKYAAFLFDWYSKALWIVALGTLLNLTKDEMQPMLSVLDQAKAQDWLLEYMLGKNGEGRPKTNSLVFPTIYSTLKQAVEESDPIKASALIKRYLEKEYYPKHRQAYWYDLHKSKHVVFFGYWSFEAAAIVKIAGIDDSSFRDNEYYPKDLLG